MKHWLLITFLAVASFLLLYRLGSNHLVDWDEAWYGDVARTMLQTGDYLKPVWNGHAFFDKPPLFYWATALSFGLFGVSGWSIRIISALAGIGTIVLVYLLSFRLFSSRFISFVSSIVLLSSIAFLFRSRTGNLDIFLTFWLMLNIYTLYQLQTKKTVWRWILVLPLVAAFLTKWFLAFGFPLVYIVWALWRRKKIPSGLIIILLAVFSGSLVWIGMYANRYGTPFTSAFLDNQFAKIAPKSSLLGGFSLEYFNFLKSGLKLWFLVLVPAVWYTWKKWHKHEALPILLFIILMVGGLSFSHNKSDWFLLPLYPLIAIVVGYSAVEWMKKYGRLGRYGMTIIVVVIAVFHLVYYKHLYITPDVTADEARIGLAAKELTDLGDNIYVTNYLIPTIRFYSERQTFAVYGNRRDPRSPWILPEGEWASIKENPRLFVVTNFGELSALRDHLAPYNIEILFRAGDKILVTKKS